MSKGKELLPEDTIILRKPFPLDDSFPMNEYLKFFKHTLGDIFKTGEGGRMGVVGRMGFQDWIATQAGKTLKEATTEWAYQFDEYSNQQEDKSLGEKLKERRYGALSDADKTFIIAFDKEMAEMGYDFGANFDLGFGWGLWRIIYGKTGTKSRPSAACIIIKHDWSIQLRLFLNNVDAHRQFIEDAPAHIKDTFISPGGECKACNTMCAPGKTYTIDGQLMSKCNHSAFYFSMPTLEKLPDYMALLAEFFQRKSNLDKYCFRLFTKYVLTLITAISPHNRSRSNLFAYGKNGTNCIGHRRLLITL